MRSVQIGLVAALALGIVACDDQPYEDAGSGTEAATEAGAKTNPEDPAEEGSPDVNENEPDASVCGADKLDRWLNVLPTDDVKAEIRDTVGHNRIRYIAPGDMVTMDFRPDRLNVETGTDGRIQLFRCG